MAVDHIEPGPARVRAFLVTKATTVFSAVTCIVLTLVAWKDGPHESLLRLWQIGYLTCLVSVLAAILVRRIRPCPYVGLWPYYAALFALMVLLFVMAVCAAVANMHWLT